MTLSSLSPALAGLGLGIALAGAPGPVQAVLMSESIRGGVARGLRALAGASVTFGTLLVALALGLSVAAPSGSVLRAIQVIGGAFLLWLAFDGLRSARGTETVRSERPTLPPAARGALAVLLNPGGWLFLGAVASPLFTTATQRAGEGSAVLAAAGLIAGLATGDGAVVVLGGVGVRRAGDRVARPVRRILALILAAVGVWLMIRGVTG